MHGNNTFWRHDTFFGVCEAIGQDFGFNANWLRIAFAVALLLSAKIVLTVYFGLGAVVLASRLLFPMRHAVQGDTSAVRAAGNDDELAGLPLAA